MALYFSIHASDRLGRLAAVDVQLTQADVERKLQRFGKLGVGETAFLVKRIGRKVKVRDGQGIVSNGDLVYVVFRRCHEEDEGVITTVEFRNTWQGPSQRWSRVIDVCAL